MHAKISIFYCKFLKLLDKISQVLFSNFAKNWWIAIFNSVFPKTISWFLFFNSAFHKIFSHSFAFFNFAFFSFAIFPSLKVEYNNIRELPLCLLRSYLTDGTQRAKIGKCISDPLTVACGVPQGSVLGHLLFLLCIKNIYLSSPMVTFHLFADDTEGVHLTLPSHIFPSK